MGKTDINNLGQYFTPANIAEYMANEVVSATPSSCSVLDPCIGENIFFSFLDFNSMNLQGVEIDETLIKNETHTFFNKPNRNLIVGDFIDQKFDQKFDAVIMNPPYTRQEKISLATKKKLQTINGTAGIKLSAKANLYVYFLLKGLLLLKNNGLLVAITYDSWLYSSFGANFKRYLVDNHNLEQIIHFKNDAFNGVDVGATILVIQKGGTTNFTKYAEYESANNFSLSSMATKTTGRIIRQGKNFSIEEASADDPIYTQGFIVGARNKASVFHSLTPDDLLNLNDSTLSKHSIKFPSSHFVTLDTLSDRLLWRGTSSPANKYFLFKHNKEGLSPILKKTPQDTYSMILKDAVYALAVSPENITSEIHEQLEQIKQELLETGSDSLKEKIKNDPYWYKFPLKPGGEILFNYYFRNNPRFILNEDNIATMGNYYNISCPSTMYETLALLNSSLTRCALLRYSKSQGRGLRKIQLYKFNQIPVLPLEKFTSGELTILKKLGKLLANNQDAINEIDGVVLKRYCQLLDVNYTNTKSIIDMELSK